MDKKRKYNESDDDTSTASDDDLQSSEATENESGTEMEDESDPWIPIIEEVQRRHATAYENAKQSFSDNGFDNEAAKEKAYELVLPKLLTEFERAYLERVLWMRQLKRDPVHRKIMKTRDDFIDNDDFDTDEALEAAISFETSFKTVYFPRRRRRRRRKQHHAIILVSEFLTNLCKYDLYRFKRIENHY